MARSARKPLAGKRILVTRAEHQAGKFSRILRRLGATPVEFPLIEIKPVRSARLDRFLERFCSGRLRFDYIIFTSRNGADDFFRRTGARAGMRALRTGSVVAIGPGTADALRKRRVPIKAVPEKYVAESVADLLLTRDLRGKRVLLLRARGAREILPRRLREAGAEVFVRSLYEAVSVSASAKELKEEIRKVDFITVASGSTVRSLAAIAGNGKQPAPQQLRRFMGKARLASIGPVTSRTARSLGLRVDVEAREHTMPGLAGAIAGYVQEAR
jgi:uroporphyrinogen III methyltransferase/synthase